MESPPTFLRCGLVAKILWNSNQGQRPLIGAYFSPDHDSWIPCNWTTDGNYIDSENPTNLDVLI